MKTRRQAFMALLISEQLDPRVDQQWINMAAIAVQRVPIGMGYHILKGILKRYRHCTGGFWIKCPNPQVQVQGWNNGTGSPFFFCGERTLFLLLWGHIALLFGKSVIFVKCFKNTLCICPWWLKAPHVLWPQEQFCISSWPKKHCWHCKLWYSYIQKP